MSRIAVVDNDKIKQMEDKLHIQSLCPVNRTGTECIHFEGEKLRIDETTCIGCGICVKAAPNAISIINFPDEKISSPIHQFGYNGFRIFDLPKIHEHAITGIIGRNGIGKSTVINILSNTIKANFARFGKHAIDEKDYFKHITSLFKGTVMQDYFLKLEKQEIKIAYKPQQIINIPKLFSGTVKELLKKVNPDETIIEKTATQLNIKEILDRDIKVLSGGELQRVALSSALLKTSATFYVFDEITNYLDIYERINSAKKIQEETKDKTAMVVEHDLIVLDFLTDYIHIMYGQPSTYGMLTGVKSGRVGINNYLEGFSKEENVKFRDKPIVFDRDSDSVMTKGAPLTSWEKDSISRGEFSLSIESGDIKKGEIIGVIGRNALGKSTFINHVAENGFENTTISYKPQLIPQTDTLVLSELSQFDTFRDSFYDMFVLEPLKIKPLLEKQVNELSGGELQRYSIAKCLLQDADIYLLDEPTAFLDVEDRLSISKMLKNFIETKQKSAFIVDHDLVFMDYLSNRLQVFDGTPSKQGTAHTPKTMREGMNHFLKGIGITFRRDENNKRPRVNKPNSVKDSEQKQKGEYYYA